MSASPIVVITGASSGIGYAIAQAYLDRGARVVANGRDRGKLESAAQKLGHSDRLALVPGDIGEEGTAERLIEAARSRFGGLDVVVNNAGVFSAKGLVEYTRGDLQSFVATNLLGTVLLTQAAVRSWRGSKSTGAIVNITASIALAPQKALPASLPVAIKGGLNAMTKALALELAEERITVNAVAPGIIETPLISNPERLGGAQPIGRIGAPREIADAVIYLASSPFVTGVVLPVDGGMASGRW
jgi:NAD(P)-dependent dehydrogenase (short-subunit alcohol dehydrogenase family)